MVIFGEINDPLLRFAEPLDTEFNQVSGFEVLRWLHAQTDASRSAGADYVSGKQRHKFADIRNQRGDPKNHVSGGTVLASFSVHLEPHLQIAGIFDFVLACEKRA